MTKIGLIQFLVLFVISAAYGQKVKYKDIYALLSTKQFELAEPFLKKYLQENTDNPNAYLYMGNIFQEKSSRNDILNQTLMAVANMDSAILYFDKAYKTIDDREVRKNEDYYQAYNRRDLRTGQFGVKLSDIQFDIEKKIEGLKERKDGVKMSKQFFDAATHSYVRAQALYGSIQKAYPSERHLLLRSDEQTVKDLAALSVRFDSCMKAFDQYKTSVSALGKTGYNQTVKIREISDFKSDGTTPADFYQDEPALWDYKKFADKARQTIEKGIIPIRENLVTYDIEINKLRDRMSSESVSVRSDLMKLIDRLLYEQLRQFDPEPLPMALFNLKTADLEYRSMVLEHVPYRDSSNLHLRISLLNEELKMLRKLDSTGVKLTDRLLEEKAPDYRHFIESTYHSTAVLKSYINTQKEFAERELEKKQAALDECLKSLNYIVDGADSIPLVAKAPGVFKPLLTMEEKFTLGLSFRDSLHVEGYFYTITPSRMPDVKAHFPLGKNWSDASGLMESRALGYADTTRQAYFVMLCGAQAVKEKFPATVAKIDRANGLAWKVDYPLAFVPSELSMNPETGALIMRSGGQEVVIGKDGKVVVGSR